MELLYLPPSLRYFAPLRVLNGSPGEHASLEYDLVEALRPELVVDLGADNALSFSVLCQSMHDHEIDGLAYAIDTWESDGERESRGDASWTSINNFLHAHYRFAYLLRHDADGAIAHFADASVDLLRLDGARLSRPLDALLDAWMPKIAPGGALLCPGIAEGSKEHDVWRTRVPHGFVFDEQRLGVALLDSPGGEVANHELLRWLRAGSAVTRAAVASFYGHAQRHHALRIQVAEHGADLVRKHA